MLPDTVMMDNELKRHTQYKVTSQHVNAPTLSSSKQHMQRPNHML